MRNRMERIDKIVVSLLVVGILCFFAAIVCGQFGATTVAIVLIAIFGCAFVGALGVGFLGKDE